jgi:putative membrane protein
MKVLLRDAAAELREASGDMDAWFARVENAADAQELGDLRTLLSQDAELLASLWASPVRVDTHLVYEMENYGSAMAPFYTTLSIWVGGIILVAMIKVEVSDEQISRLRQYGKVRTTEQYFGRSILFLVLGLIQTTIICLGDLLFLGIQCPHPFLFLLAGWVSSIIYVLLIYTMTISFGDVGKAAAVSLLVIQVAGSGGTFPIELAPAVFQKLYPLLPFVHTMNAMRECIAGMYQNTYWREIGTLLLYLIPILLLGLVLRRPVIRLNQFFEEKLEEVKFM